MPLGAPVAVHLQIFGPDEKWRGNKEHVWVCIRETAQFDLHLARESSY